MTYHLFTNDTNFFSKQRKRKSLLVIKKEVELRELIPIPPL